MRTQPPKANTSKRQSSATPLSNQNGPKSSTFQFKDQRSATAQQKKWQAMMNSSAKVTPSKTAPLQKQGENPIQRLVAVTGDTSDALVANNIEYALGQFNGPLVTLDKSSDFTNLGAGNRVGIVGHGGPGSINGLSGEEVAKKLTTGKKPMPKDVGLVTVYSCNAALNKTEGEGADEKDIPASSLVHELSTALHGKGYDPLVSGMYGILFGFNGIGERTTKGMESKGDLAWFGSEEDGIVGARDRILLKYPKIGSAKTGFFSTDEILENHDIDVKEMDQIQKIRKITEIMTPFWRDIETLMDSEDTLSEHLKGWLYVNHWNKDTPETFSDTFQA